MKVWLAGATALRLLPSALLVIFAGLVSLLALFFDKGRREYAAQLARDAFEAACAMSAGQPISRIDDNKLVLCQDHEQSGK